MSGVIAIQNGNLRQYTRELINDSIAQSQETLNSLRHIVNINEIIIQPILKLARF
ncbi:hypothetical protein BH23BAC2_BH23BAC2_10650 [soil metagenome]